MIMGEKSVFRLFTINGRRGRGRGWGVGLIVMKALGRYK